MSLVLVSPSTESWFQVRTAAGRRRPARTAGSTAASVRTTASIVAIRGWIMPTPLAMPETVTRTLPPSAAGSSTLVVASFVTESVVRRASAAAASPASAVASATMFEATPAATRSSGRRVPMIPVDRWSTCSVATPAAALTIRPISAWSASPAGPVAALAEPLVEITTSAQPYRPRGSPDVAARFACDCFTGAAANAFGVNTAAAAAGPSVVRISTRSGRPEALIPMAAPPAAKPAGRAARRSTSGRLVGSSGIGRVAWTVVIAV